MKLLSSLRDPVSGLTHLAGALLGVVAMVFLVVKAAAQGTTVHVVAFSIFSVSLVLLYSSSALYHLLNVSPQSRIIFRRLDHMMIFILIAGSYTPFCLLPLRGPWGWTLLTIVWSIALGGLLATFFWVRSPRWFRTALYLVMGWLIVVAIFPLARALSAEGLGWLVAAGAFYTVGAGVYAIKRPNPFPPVFGFHEIWHVFVLLGSASHFLSVTTLLP